MEELTVRDWFILVGLITGILYGVIAQASDFCVRRGIADFAEGKGTRQCFRMAWGHLYRFAANPMDVVGTIP